MARVLTHEILREPNLETAPIDQVSPKTNKTLVTHQLSPAGAGIFVDLRGAWSAISILDCVSQIRTSTTTEPVFLKYRSSATLAQFLELSERVGLAGPLAVHGLGVAGQAFTSDDEYLMRAVAKSRCGLVLSPWKIDREGIAGAEIDWIIDAMGRALDWAVAKGAPGPIFLDALSWPALIDPAGTRRSISLVQRYNEYFPSANSFVTIDPVGAGTAANLQISLESVLFAAMWNNQVDTIACPYQMPHIERLSKIASEQVRPEYGDEFFLQKLIQLELWEVLETILDADISPSLKEAVYQIYFNDPLTMEF
tara:strand:+ start:5395 stop:6324 length:930 start_codon:yes stop_codon:yes gene_type:complete